MQQDAAGAWSAEWSSTDSIPDRQGPHFAARAGMAKRMLATTTAVRGAAVSSNFPMDRVFAVTEFLRRRQIFLKNIAVTPLKKVLPSQKRRGPQK